MKKKVLQIFLLIASLLLLIQITNGQSKTYVSERCSFIPDYNNNKNDSGLVFDIKHYLTVYPRHDSLFIDVYNTITDSVYTVYVQKGLFKADPGDSTKVDGFYGDFRGVPTVIQISRDRLGRVDGISFWDRRDAVIFDIKKEDIPTPPLKNN